MLSSAPSSASPLRPFAARVLVVMVLGGLALLAWQLSELLLIVFGAVVVGVLLHGLASALRKRLPVPEWAALGLVILFLVLALSAIVLLFGTEVAAQIDAFRTTLPAAWNKFHAWLQSGPLGPQIKSIPDQLRDGASTLATHAGAIVLSAGGGITDAVLMLVGGVYLAAQPKLYRRGLLRLLPRDRRDVADAALTASGQVLRAWLGGQFLAMLVIGSLTGLGLWLLGVPVALGIGLLTALLDFIPIVGPIVAAVPAVLLGFTVSPQVALGALLVFVVLQQIEGHVLQPLIQARAVNLPPALLLFSLFGIGLLFGPIGVVLAAPLTVVIYVLVKHLYVHHALDDADEAVPAD
ncbi:AI-2E family transporter [Xanthomonas hyacinthi]|uniref:AI-2E family transporter n=2 Tax=Xanthomonas hyacinthi TaxID=56455 RepID=A0A2S7EX86_9XANT|nr:AI-2E family transporter [Xanthomonas hyacinthi]QGY77143.1 AI-2E family transporter [Xanthomonas hyacinthi]